MKSGVSTLKKRFNKEEVAVRINDTVKIGSNLLVSKVWELMLYL